MYHHSLLCQQRVECHLRTPQGGYHAVVPLHRLRHQACGLGDCGHRKPLGHVAVHVGRTHQHVARHGGHQCRHLRYVASVRLRRLRRESHAVDVHPIVGGESIFQREPGVPLVTPAWQRGRQQHIQRRRPQGVHRRRRMALDCSPVLLVQVYILCNCTHRICQFLPSTCSFIQS